MGVLQDFERRLEDAVEGFFARAFRSGLQPVELAKAIQRYAEDHRRVASDGVVVPNQYRVSISAEDHERLSTYDSLVAELERVVDDTATERGWLLRGAADVTVLADDDVAVGRLALTGRVHDDGTVAPTPQPATPAPAAPAAAPTPPSPAVNGTHADDVARLEGVDRPLRLPLEGTRMTIGRLPTCSFVLDDDTISREHAVVVRRSREWWILDQNSTNGTRVNGRRTAESRLEAGDEVELGDVRLVFRGAS